MLTRSQFINTYAPAAQRVYEKYGVFPQTVLTLAIVESQGKSNDGNYYPGLSANARLANNYFGIKAFNWNGPTIKLATKNDKDKISTFRKYASVSDSFEDFAKFLRTNDRYEDEGVFTAPDFLTQITRIAKAGYAENPRYLELLKTVSSSVNNAIKQVKEITKKPESWFILLAIAGVLFYNFNKKKNGAKI